MHSLLRTTWTKSWTAACAPCKKPCWGEARQPKIKRLETLPAAVTPMLQTELETQKDA